MNNGHIIKAPYIPIPENVSFVHQDFSNGFFGHVRLLRALEIAQLFNIMETQATSKALINGFTKVVKDE